VSSEPPVSWQQVAGAADAISTDFAFHAGVYGAGDKLFAVNRAAAEELAPVLPDTRVAALFRGLDFARVDDQAGNLAALIQEIWRLFLASMMIALIVEAALCLPKQLRRSDNPVWRNRGNESNVATNSSNATNQNEGTSRGT
jgi:hypothetical protein